MYRQSSCSGGGVLGDCFVKEPFISALPAVFETLFLGLGTATNRASRFRSLRPCI